MRKKHRLAKFLIVLLVFSICAFGLSHLFNTSHAQEPTARVCVRYDFGGDFGSPNVRPYDPDLSSSRWIGVVAEGPYGDLYSTSPSGGKFVKGTVFKITRDGKLTVLWDFGGVKDDGAGPQGGLKLATDGNFYGTTYEGGRWGMGTIFRISPGMGQPTILYDFRNYNFTGLKPPNCPTWPNCPFSARQRLDAAGAYPNSAPVQAKDGNFYGVTSESTNQKFGVLYRISPSGGFTALCIGGSMPSDPVTDAQLRDRCMFNGVNGNFPSSLTVGTNDNFLSSVLGGEALYGTTLGDSPHGTVFKATLAGKVSTLRKFNSADGAKPYSVIQGSDGNLYGTTQAGGAGYGVVYKLTLAGDLTVLHSFTGSADGHQPVAGVVEGKVKEKVLGREIEKSDGYLYGATKYGGTTGRGVLYRIRIHDYDFKVLHNFDLYATGRMPIATPMLHSDGNFYGTTSQGGQHDKGVFYRLSGVDLPDLDTNPSDITGGTPVVLNDPVKDGVIFAVRTAVTASQLGKTNCLCKLDQNGNCPPPEHQCLGTKGISVSVTCRNPHIVQFIYREQQTNTTPRTWRVGTTPKGYDLTTDLNNKIWDTDARSGKPNAYVDQANRTAHSTYTAGGKTVLTIWDQPTLVPILNLDWLGREGREDIVRATVWDYVICNCRVVRVIKWTREKAGENAPTYSGISIAPASDADLKWINKQLGRNGFDPIP